MGANVETKLITPKAATRKKQKMGLFIIVGAAIAVLVVLYYLYFNGYI